LYASSCDDDSDEDRSRKPSLPTPPTQQAYGQGRQGPQMGASYSESRSFMV
jgi:hypothetical protein